MDAILESHIDLCERVYALLLEENRILKQTGKAPDEEFLSRKRLILSELETSTPRVREAAVANGTKTPQQRALIEKAQQAVLKTLLLDRENEQLLLKSTLMANTASLPMKPAPGHLQRIYKKHSS